jgi:hypothetical protein
MFKKKTLDSILSDFTKTISKLEGLINTNNDKASSNSHVISQLEKDNHLLLTEADKAEAVRQKLISLVS